MPRLRLPFTRPSVTISAVANARRDLVVLAVLISAVALLIWNGSTFFHRLALAEHQYGPSLKLASTALTLNVALILFGWRRYVDLHHEAERRVEGEHNARIMASTDGITGLLNRKGFGDAGHGLCVAPENATRHLVIVSIQLHRFKSVNDRHGYEMGDAVLRRIGGELLLGSPVDAVVGRVSGDEFAIAFILDEEALPNAAATAATLLQRITRPIEESGKIIEVGAFSGLAATPVEGLHLPDLLRRADIAMNHALSGRSARPVWFDGGMERALVAHGELEQGIRDGIEHDQFVPYFEPQVDLATGEVIGFEVLARWDHPLSGLLPPDSFIPAAEEMGIIGRLTDQVIGKALAAAAGWNARLHLAINISPVQLSDSWLAHKIVRLLTETGFPAERLIVELTESSLFADLDLARQIVASLKNQGVRLALDDFGSGFSSLSNLRALPFDMIKIDRNFVGSLHRDRQSEAIVRAVTTLAEAIGVPVTAEGIEDAATLESVIGMGCAIGQGWYFGKPMTAEDTCELIRAADARILAERPARSA